MLMSKELLGIQRKLDQYHQKPYDETSEVHIDGLVQDCSNSNANTLWSYY